MGLQCSMLPQAKAAERRVTGTLKAEAAPGTDAERENHSCMKRSSASGDDSLCMEVGMAHSAVCQQLNRAAANACGRRNHFPHLRILLVRLAAVQARKTAAQLWQLRSPGGGRPEHRLH